MGTVKFLGSTDFAAGEWLGIELDDKAGKNDGSVKGKQYFTCKAEHGIFVRPTAAMKVEPPLKVEAREAKKWSTDVVRRLPWCSSKRL